MSFFEKKNYTRIIIFTNIYIFFYSRTVKNIKEGEEITINYRPDVLGMKNWITRQTYILENFRFTCLCDFCDVEEDEKDLEEYEKYEKLWADAKEVKRQGFEFPSQPYWA